MIYYIYLFIIFLVESSYFRRHCISHVLPNPLSKQIYFYKCYYCDDGFQTKHMFISHMLAHESDDHVCRECKEHFSSERALFCHMIVHGHTKCPACDEVFNEKNSTGNCSQSSLVRTFAWAVDCFVSNSKYQPQIYCLKRRMTHL